jgi:uncharacterized protein
MKTSLSVFLLIIILTLSEFATAQTIDIPELYSRVTDLCGLLTDSQKETIDKQLTDFETENGGQIAVLILPTTGDEDIEDFGIRLAEAWQIGHAGANDGLILIVAKNDRKVRLEVAYGLEHLIPDVLAARIIDEYIVPEFQNGDFYGGISDGLMQCMAYLDGQLVYEPEKTIVESVTDQQRDKLQTPFGIMLMVAVIIICISFFIVMWHSIAKYLVFFGLCIITFISAYFYLDQNPVIVSIMKFMSIWGILPILIIKLLWEAMILLGWVTRSKTHSVSRNSSSSQSSSSHSYSNRSSSYSSSSSSGNSYSGSSFSGGGGSFGGGGASGSW